MKRARIKSPWRTNIIGKKVKKKTIIRKQCSTSSKNNKYGGYCRKSKVKVINCKSVPKIFSILFFEWFEAIPCVQIRIFGSRIKFNLLLWIKFKVGSLLFYYGTFVALQNFLLDSGVTVKKLVKNLDTEHDICKVKQTV